MFSHFSSAQKKKTQGPNGSSPAEASPSSNLARVVDLVKCGTQKNNYGK
jgi:hypothetical protein